MLAAAAVRVLAAAMVGVMVVAAFSACTSEAPAELNHALAMHTNNLRIGFQAFKGSQELSGDSTVQEYSYTE